MSKEVDKEKQSRFYRLACYLIATVAWSLHGMHFFEVMDKNVKIEGYIFKYPLQYIAVESWGLFCFAIMTWLIVLMIKEIR